MDIVEFKRTLTAFADEPADVDVRLGKIVAQLRDELIDASLSYSTTSERTLLVTENDASYPARVWLINRIAKIPQLAERIIASTNVTPQVASQSPFVCPTGVLTADLSDDENSIVDRRVEDTVSTLLEKVANPLPGATSVMYVTSDAGEGKTTILNRAARVQAERFKEKKTSALLVPIPLSGRAFLTFDDAVIAALVNRLRFNYFYFDGFVQLVRMGVIVPAFDGYEEMLVEGSKGEAISALGNLVQILESSGTVLIAARKAFFEYLSFKTQARLLDAIGDRSASFSRLALSRWSKSQFCEYGRLRGSTSPEEIYQVVADRFMPDHPLLTRAVLVRRLFDMAIPLSNPTDLAQFLGTNPQDYFYAFVDAIVRREASEKWLARVTGEVMEPLLSVEEHHTLLSMIAHEMWQSATTSLRYDVLDTIVDLFSETAKKRGSAVRQIKERLRQHSLLAVDSSRGGLAFDHEDFQFFYVGESLGAALARGARTEIQAILSVSLVARLAVEQSVHHLVRHNANLEDVLKTIVDLSTSEVGFSICKENCGMVAVRLAESMAPDHKAIAFESMFLPSGALGGRLLRRVTFKKCHFQPSGLQRDSLADVTFADCEFERLEISADANLKGCRFIRCQVNSLLVLPSDQQLFDPVSIVRLLERRGATVVSEEQATTSQPVRSDEFIVLFERFLRTFLRRTHVDDTLIKLKLGNQNASTFVSKILPKVISAGIIEEVPWRGGGVRKRYKLIRPLAELDAALERSQGNFEKFLSHLKR